MWQIESLGVVIDFARIKRNALLINGFGTAFILILTVESYFHFVFKHEVHSGLDQLKLILHYSSYVLQNGVSLCEILQYTEFLKALRQRHQHINNLLRFELKTLSLKVATENFIHCRCRFLGNHDDKQMKLAAAKRIAVKQFIKWVGQLHDKLCKIMEDVNYLYSFQACHRLN